MPQDAVSQIVLYNKSAILDEVPLCQSAAICSGHRSVPAAKGIWRYMLDLILGKGADVV